MDAPSDAGSIPAASTISALFTAGQNLPNPRQIESQPGQSQEVTRVFPVEEGTVTALQQSHPGSITSITSAQREHNENASDEPVDPDLRSLVEAWSRLPQDVRHVILVLVGQNMEREPGTQTG